MNEHEIPTPVNTIEHLLYAQVIRLDAMCNMLNSIIEVMGKSNNIAMEDNVVKTSTPPKPTRRKGGVKNESTGVNKTNKA